MLCDGLARARTDGGEERAAWEKDLVKTPATPHKRKGGIDRPWLKRAQVCRTAQQNCVTDVARTA